MRYGGHTSCVALAHDGQVPTLALDAGTGLRAVTELLGSAPFRGTILLTHLHWDHTQGLPFFAGGDRPDAVVDLHLPEQGMDPAALLERAMGPPHFPIGPAQLQGAWRFAGIDEGTHRIAGFHVLAREIPHKGGRTFGYRISDGRATIAYMPDHWPVALGPGPDGFGELHHAALVLADGVDVLLHDAQYSSAEFPARAHYGHSAVDYAVALAVKAGVGRLLLFHHDPGHDDETLDGLVAGAQRPGLRVAGAREGHVIEP